MSRRPPGRLVPAGGIPRSSFTDTRHLANALSTFLRTECSSKAWTVNLVTLAEPAEVDAALLAYSRGPEKART